MAECTFCQFASSFASSWRAKDSFSEHPRFYDDYSTSKELGRGQYGIVKQCKRKSDGATYAVKIINKKNLSEAELNALQDEITILEALDHFHITNMYAKYEDYKNYYLVLELVAGGELFDRIVKKKTYNEKETAEACKVIFEALKHCHERNVVHRDIKPENLLLTSETNDTDIKITDFGFAKYVDGDNLTTLCGTPAYVATEIIRKKPYGVKVDIWSFGVIVYLMLCGYQPFEEDDLIKLFKKIRRGKFAFHEKYWGDVSDDAKDLVANLLLIDPSKRFSADEALQSQWLREDADVLSLRNLDNSRKRLKKFQARKKFKSAVRAVVVATRFSKLSSSVVAEVSADSLSDSDAENGLIEGIKEESSDPIEK